MAELLAPHARRYVCVDNSSKVVLAASERLRRIEQVEVMEGDMQALPFDKPTFDLVLLMHALTYADKPALAISEAARVLRKDGRLLLTCLAKHEHASTVAPYGHVNLGFTEKDLRRFAAKAGLEVEVCHAVTQEKRPPHFEVLALQARKE
jgi:ubiquinone/menaquinone biosynthesis C-methylase UbiE